MKILYIALLLLIMMSGCSVTPSAYHFETSTIASSRVKFGMVTTKMSAGKTFLTGRLFGFGKLGPQRQGYLVITIYNETGELLQTQIANYQTPLSIHEWRQAGVYFSVQLTQIPPENSLIKVVFCE